MQNLPRTSEGLSPARLFFQREVRSPMLYTPPCDKDEMAAGLQRHHDRERNRDVRNARRGKGLESPLELYVGQKVFLQDEVKRGHPFSIPGTVVSIRDSGRSGWVWCPGKARRFLRNRRKMRTMMDDEDEDEGAEPSVDEEEMIDEEVLEDLGDEEVHDALSAGTVMSSGTRVPVPQVTTSADSQLPSALRAVQTAPRAGQLGAGGEKVQAVRFTLPCFHRANIRSGEQSCPGLLTTGTDFEHNCCCEQETSSHRLCGGEFYQS